LFGSQHDDNQKTEIVLSITPHLIRNVQRPEAGVSEFSAGTEANFRRRPDLSARPAAQLPAAPGARTPLPAPQPNTPQGAVPSAVQLSPAAPSSAPEPAMPLQASPLPPSQGQPAPLPPSAVQPQPVQPAPQPVPPPEPGTVPPQGQ